MAHGRGRRPKLCRQCGLVGDDEHVISYRALCADCAIANVREACSAFVDRDGPAYERWRQAQREAAQRVLDTL